MPKFGKESTAKLATCHPNLIIILNEAIKYVDFTVLEGHRGKELQNLYFSQGKSKLRWPHGEHNSTPSNAVDVAPWPIDWADVRRFIRLLSFIQGIGFGLGIPIRIGGDWNSDFIFNENFHDWPHIELKEKI